MIMIITQTKQSRFLNLTTNSF